MITLKQGPRRGALLEFSTKPTCEQLIGMAMERINGTSRSRLVRTMAAASVATYVVWRESNEGRA